MSAPFGERLLGAGFVQIVDVPILNAIGPLGIALGEVAAMLGLLQSDDAIGIFQIRVIALFWIRNRLGQGNSPPNMDTLIF